MKMRYAMMGLTIGLAGYATSASALEPSAALQQSKGQVFIGQTTAMAKAQQGMPLYAGNRVVAAAGGGAKIVYPDGCTVALQENSVLTISGPDQCKTGQAVVHRVGGFQNARIGQAGPVTSKNAVAAVRQVKGTGQVDQAPATPGMNLSKGNRVTAGVDSQIVVRYADGCEVVVEAGKSLLIGDQPVCTPGLVVGGGGVVVGASTAGAVGAGVAAGAVAGGGIGVGAMAIAGLGLGSLVAAGASDDDNNDSSGE